MKIFLDSPGNNVLYHFNQLKGKNNNFTWCRNLLIKFYEGFGVKISRMQGTEENIFNQVTFTKTYTSLIVKGKNYFQ